MARKLAAGAAVAFAAFYAVTHPYDAASFIHTVMSGIGTCATALADGLAG